MKARTFLAVAVALVPLWMAGPKAAGTCDPIGNLQFVCDQAGPEDLAVVPGGQWVIATAYARDKGGIRLINVRDKTTTVVFPTIDPSNTLKPVNKPRIKMPSPRLLQTDGWAFHLFHDVNKHFPFNGSVTGQQREVLKAAKGNDTHSGSWGFQILPYLDQVPLPESRTQRRSDGLHVPVRGRPMVETSNGGGALDRLLPQTTPTTC